MLVVTSFCHIPHETLCCLWTITEWRFQHGILWANSLCHFPTRTCMSSWPFSTTLKTPAKGWPVHLWEALKMNTSNPTLAWGLTLGLGKLLVKLPGVYTLGRLASQIVAKKSRSAQCLTSYKLLICKLHFRSLPMYPFSNCPVKIPYKTACAFSWLCKHWPELSFYYRTCFSCFLGLIEVFSLL